MMAQHFSGRALWDRMVRQAFHLQGLGWARIHTTAVYGGDANCVGSTSSPTTESVVTSTSATLTSNILRPAGKTLYLHRPD